MDFDGALIPFCVEVWATADAGEKDQETYSAFRPLLNRSPTLTRLIYDADSTGLRIYGCGLDFKVKGPKRAYYDIDLSIITPHLRLTGDGKAPYLGHFREAIENAIKGAAGAAYRNLVRPAVQISIADAAMAVMEEAYLKASDNGTLPAKARQIMYAARGKILELTGLKKFSDTYFTQTLLPDYLQNFPEETANWDVVYDARGNLTEPHTGRRVPLGTVQVRGYLGLRANQPNRPQLQANGLYPTVGPRHRYKNVLFVEKEGFDELFEAVQLAERYDLAIMSTKGMSVVAARALLDNIAELVDHVFVLHDFDVSGFSIFGTLGTDSRRYTFESDLSDVIHDIGLRLGDAQAMGLEAETVEVKSREARRETLKRHGATAAEIGFLAPGDEDQDCRRVELNAMTSRQLVDFVEAALADYRVDKLVPDGAVIRQHARHHLETKLTGELIAQHAEAIAERAAAAELPADLVTQVTKLLGGTCAIVGSGARPTHLNLRAAPGFPEQSHRHASPVGRNTPVADHRRNPRALQRLAVEPVVFRGQDPALRHRRVIAQRRAAVLGAGRVTLHQRDRRQKDIAIPTACPERHRNPRHHGRARRPVTMARRAAASPAAIRSAVTASASAVCSSSTRCCNSSIRLRPSSTRRLSSVSAAWNSSARSRSASRALLAISS